MVASATKAKRKRSNSKDAVLRRSKKQQDDYLDDLHNIGDDEEVESPTRINVHRIRDMLYQPSDIVAMAAIPTRNQVVVSRSDGSVELKSSEPSEDGDTSLRTLTRIHTPYVATSLAVIGDTVAAASTSGWIAIVDFSKATYRNLASVPPVHALTTCGNSSIVSAHQDGTIRLYSLASIEEGGSSDKEKKTLEWKASAPVGSPVLSVCSNDKADNATIYAGVADGTIRSFTISNTQKELTQGNLRITVESKGSGRSTRIWCLAVHHKGQHLISGNSMGHVQVWDLESGTLMQSISQNELQADVLALACHQTKVFASGVDSRVVCLEYESRKKAYVVTGAQRPHTHDVKSLVAIPGSKSGNYQPAMLLSGGVDTKVASYSIRDFAKQRPRVFYPWPAHAVVSSMKVNDQQVLILQQESSLQLYTMNADDQSTDLRSTLKVVSSDQGRLFNTVAKEGRIATCYGGTVCIFEVNNSNKENFRGASFEPRKIFSKTLSSTIVALAFHQQHLIAATANNKLHIYDMNNLNSKAITMSFPSTGKVPIHTISCRDDDSSFMTLTSAEEVHVLSTSNWKHCWKVPSSQPCASTVLKDDSSKTTVVVVAAADWKVLIWDLSSQTLLVEHELHSSLYPTSISVCPDFPKRLVVVSSSF